MYEAGWKKKVSYVIGFSIDGIRDVTLRYTRNYNEVKQRRISVSEEWLSGFINFVNQNRYFS